MVRRSGQVRVAGDYNLLLGQGGGLNSTQVQGGQVSVADDYMDVRVG